jgi:hypothetical protein
MLKKRLLLAVALGFVIGSTTSARADLCFRYQKSGGGKAVARGATLPARDTCNSLALFESGGGAGAANGVICRDGVENRTILFHYTYHSCLGPNYFESGTCRMQLDDNNNFVSSTCRGTFATNGGMSTFLVIDDGVVESCTGIVVPGGGGGACFGSFFHLVPPVPPPAPPPSR